MKGLQSAADLFLSVFDPVMRPPVKMSVADWFAQNVVLIDGPRAGQTWSPDGAPYLVEIANCLGDDDPCHTVTIRKSQQSGASILALAWCLFIAAVEPANILYAVPGLESLKEVASQKLDPLIRAFERHIERQVFASQTSRSGQGSKSREKRFADSYMFLGNANSVMDLSSKTIKKGVKDEMSKWEKLHNGADPETLYKGRFTAFRGREDFKILGISTPEVDTGDADGAGEGHCRIDRAFKASDQRYWNVPCPKCERLFVHQFDRLKIDYDQPARTRYLCNHCDHPISEAERIFAVKQGRWIASVEGEGLQPGFHIDAFISLMMSYKAIAEDWIDASKGSEKDKKDFYNVDLGLPYKYKGDAPDYKILLERREDGLKRYHVPPQGLMIFAAADVQMRGIWFEIIAVSPDRQTWSLDHGYIDGETDHPSNPVFDQLRRRTLDATFPDAFGGARRIDALAVDSGYRAHVIYTWVRANQRMNPISGKEMVFAVKGDDGWHLPALGTPSLQDIDLDGRKVRQGAKLWPVGTWSLKAGFYSDLHKIGLRLGGQFDPPGLCHFGQWCDAPYFKQLTAEYLTDVTVKGKGKGEKKVVGQKWEKTTENHLLDCRIYNIALAEHLGWQFMTPAAWVELARLRGLPPDLVATDLFTPQGALGGLSRPPDDPEMPPEAPAPEEPENPFDAYAALNDY